MSLGCWSRNRVMRWVEQGGRTFSIGLGVLVGAASGGLKCQKPFPISCDFVCRHAGLQDRLEFPVVKGDLEASEQLALDVTLRRAIGPATAMSGLAYGLSAILHTYAGGPDRSMVAPVEAFSFVALLSLGLWLRGREIGARHAQAIVVTWAAFILVNNAVFLSVHDESLHPVILYILVLGVGLVPALPLKLYASIIIATLGVFGFTLGTADTPLHQRFEAGLTLVAAICFGVVIRALAKEYIAQHRRLHGEALRSAEARDAVFTHYREITEMANDLIAEIDEDGTMLYGNPAHERVLGYTNENLIGRRFSEFLAPDDTGRAREFLKRMLERPVGPARVGVRHANGEDRVIELSSRPYRAANGEHRIVVTSHDVTERANREAERARHSEELEDLVAERTEALRRSMAELQQRERLAAVGTLAAGVAHQINNPVGSVRMSAEFALGTPEGSEGETEVLREALSTNVAEAMRCGEIVKNLLRFARDDRSTVTKVELSSLVERVVSLCQSYAASREAVLDYDLQDRNVVVEGNSVELEQALINLIRNAIESSDRKVRVRVRLDRVGPNAVVDVRDDGDGMDEQATDQIFDPFFTTRLSEGGTGLGLSVAHGIATAHDGTLTAQSERGVGTRLRLSLPLALERTTGASYAESPPA